jgi:hypothetical protein
MKTFALAAVVILTAFRCSAQDLATPQKVQSQQDAMFKYPALTQAGSPMNLMFIEGVKYYQTVSPVIFQRDDWPMIVADFAATNLREQEKAERAERAARHH